MARPLMSSSRQDQRGYMLIATLMSLAVFASLITIAARLAGRQHLLTRAQAEGEALGQFAVGLRGFAAAAQANPALIPGGPRSGVNWLKPPGCGGLPSNPVAGYVPCGFSGSSFGSAYQTSFTYVPATNALEIRTTFDIGALGFPRSNAGLMADKLVATALSQQSMPNTGAFFTAFANVPANQASKPIAGVDPVFYAPGADEGRVVAIVNNAPSNDIYLRTDGTNQMLANLNMGGNSLGNAKDGRFTGRVQIDDGITVTNGTADFKDGVVTPDIALTSIGKAASQGFYDARVLTGANGYTVPKPDCSQVGNLPAIYVSIQGTGTPNPMGYNADALYESRVDVMDMGANWAVTPVVRGTQFDFSDSGAGLVFSKNVVEINPEDMRLVAMIRCK